MHEASFSNSNLRISLKKVVLEEKYSHKIVEEILGFFTIEGIKSSVENLDLMYNQDWMTAPKGVLKRVKAIAASSQERKHPLRRVRLGFRSSLNRGCKELIDSLREHVDEVNVL